MAETEVAVYNLPYHAACVDYLTSRGDVVVAECTLVHSRSRVWMLETTCFVVAFPVRDMRLKVAFRP